MPQIIGRALPTVLVVLSATAVVVMGLAIGTKSAGGADVYGYVSQAALWRQGDLHVSMPLAERAPWPHPEDSFAPLGYRATDRVTAVPTYAPGIPLIMAVFTAFFGEGAEYWITPLCGGGLVLLTYALGTRLSGRSVAVAAALCVAASPIVLQMTNWLLADLPASTFWVAALWLSLGKGAPNALAAGIATAVAVLIRPNLVPLALIPAFLCTRRVPGAPRPLTALAAFAAPVLLAAGFIAGLFNQLYGSPLRSGYGTTGDLYGWENFPPNAGQYARWIVASHGPLIFLFPLSVVAALRQGQPWRERVVLTMFIALVFASYLFYLRFDAWWYIRFLLPAIPVMYLLSADAVWMATMRSASAGRLGLVLFTIVCAGYGLRESLQRSEVFGVGRAQAKYIDVGNWIHAHLPPNAVVYTTQHSGNVRQYSNRLTLRWEMIDGAWLDRSIAFMIEEGYEPYLLLDEWEMPRFRRQFAGQQAARAVDRSPSSLLNTYDTVLYGLRDPSGSEVLRIPIPPR